MLRSSFLPLALAFVCLTLFIASSSGTCLLPPRQEARRYSQCRRPLIVLAGFPNASLTLAYLLNSLSIAWHLVRTTPFGRGLTGGGVRFCTFNRGAVCPGSFRKSFLQWEPEVSAMRRRRLQLTPASPKPSGHLWGELGPEAKGNLTIMKKN